jgi:hypothetical protein
MTAFASRLPFLVAVALVAAAAGDAFVETVSNSGVLGRGYDDNNHLSVIPAIVAGTILALVVIAARCHAFSRHIAASRSGDWLVAGAGRFARRAPFADVPFVVALQFVALFAMESIEQVALDGKLLGGSAWLGGPIVFALLAHAVLGSACTLLFAALMRSILTTFGSFMRDAIATICVLLARDVERSFFGAREEAPVLRTQAPHIRHLGGRAPPRPALAA